LVYSVLTVARSHNTLSNRLLLIARSVFPIINHHSSMLNPLPKSLHSRFSRQKNFFHPPQTNNARAPNVPLSCRFLHSKKTHLFQTQLSRQPLQFTAHHSPARARNSGNSTKF